MRSFWKLLVFCLLAMPAVSIVGCGPVQVSSDVTPDNTGEDSSEEDNTGGLAATEEDE
ncbi:MAG TPA: hypothetical protein P5307_15270 [Pirellulaceae bacterium]|nr:hypothetical protein [Planctomycetaceae bacterium]HRX80431.1 hypothetical protein [Pirellulaceae bacterium]